MEKKNKDIQVAVPSPLNRTGGFGGRRPMGAPVIKPKDFKGTLLRLWKYFGGEQKLLAIIFIFIIISSGIGLSVPYFIGRAIDAMSINGGTVDFKMLGLVVGSLITVYVLDGFIQFFQGWIMAGVAQRIVKKLRDTLFEKLQKLSISFFDLRTHGEIMSRLTNDIENVSTTISQSTIQLMSGIIVLVGSLAMMLYLSPLLTLASLITIPLVFLLTKTVAKKTKVLFKTQQVELGKLNGHIEENISGILVVKAFNHEEKVIEEFNEINLKLCEVGLKAQIWTGFLMPLMNVINNIGFALVAGVGGALAVN